MLHSPCLIPSSNRSATKAPRSKNLAQNNKPLPQRQATRSGEVLPAARRDFRVLAKLVNGSYWPFHDGVILRLKFEVIDGNGRVHKRSSASYVYSHCLVIHFAPHPPSNLWPKGIAACSHAEWAGSCTVAERKAARWRKETQGRPLAQGLVCRGHRDP